MYVCILSLYSFCILLLLCISVLIQATQVTSCVLLGALLVLFYVKTIVGSFNTVCRSHTSTSWGYFPLIYIMRWSRFPLFSVAFRIWITLHPDTSTSHTHQDNTLHTIHTATVINIHVSVENISWMWMCATYKEC
jgi:hypothetical protein